MSDIVERLRKGAVAPCNGCCYGDDMLEAAAEIERLRAMTTWRPIEEAPKDGTCFLAWTKHTWVIVHWIPENYFGTGESARWFPINEPTHFLPFPPPPEAQP